MYQTIKHLFGLTLFLICASTGLIRGSELKDTCLNEGPNKEFYQEACSLKETFLLSGNINYNDSLQNFLNNILSRVLRNDPGLKSKIKLYVYSSAIQNAYSLPDGSVFLNTGLLHALENESQLAFIIAHEIAHISKQHALNQYLDKKHFNEGNYNIENYSGLTYKYLTYSKENEFEADAWALRTILSTGYYNPGEATGALLSISDSIQFYKLIPSLERELNTKIYTADSLDDKSAPLEKPKEIGVFTTDLDDSYSTHPNMNKRITAIEEALKMLEFQQKEVKSDSLFFKKLKNDNWKASIQNLYNSSDYVSCFYVSYTEYHKNNDPYWLLQMIKSLYWIGYYKDNDLLDKLFENDQIYDGQSDMIKLKKYFQTIEKAEFKKLVYNYLKQKSTLYPTDHFYFYYSLMAESYLGRENARFLFSQFLTKYPNSQYTVVAQIKSK